MQYSLRNKALQLIVDTQGAEIVSLQYQSKELLWHAQEVWKRYAPILFPVIGRLKNDGYTYQNKWYTIPRDGLARDKEWLCTARSQTHLQFELTDDEETFLYYPFHFSLIVEYHLLSESEIKILFKVFNPHYVKLPFKLGFHLGFQTFDALNTCFVELQGEHLHSPISRWLLKNGLLHSRQKLVFEKSCIPLHTLWSEKEATVLEDKSITAMTLGSSGWMYRISVEAKNCTHWGIWTMPFCLKYVCLGPWVGAPDTEEAPEDLLSKKGFIYLSAYQHWQWEVRLCVSDYSV